MARPAANELTDREIELMHVFWGGSEMTAADAREKLAASGVDRAYVTVANLVRILVDKGFLRALSTLALRRDDAISEHECPHMMTVFTGQLTRRIKMLRSMDGRKQSSGNRRPRPIFVIAAIIALCTATIAVRGFAQPPTGYVTERETKPQATDSVKARAVSRSRIELPGSRTAANGPYFRHILVPTSVIAPNDEGLAVFRIKELLERPAIAVAEPFIVEKLTSWFQAEFPNVDAPGIELSVIEWGACKAKVEVKFNAEAEKGKRHKRILGTDFLHVKLNREVNLGSWISTYAPTAIQHVVKGHDVFELPAIAELGPAPLWLTARDDGIVSIAFKVPNQELTKDTTVNSTFGDRKAWQASPAPAWDRQWEDVGAGLISIAFTDKEMTHVTDPDTHGTKLTAAGDEFVAAVIQRWSHHSWGFDTDASGVNCALKGRMTHRSGSAARESADEFRRILELLNDEKNTTVAASEDQATMDRGVALLRQTQFAVEDNDDGTADLVLTVSMSIDQLAAGL